MGIVNSIKAKANSIPVIGGAFGFDIEGILEELGYTNNMNSYSVSDENININHDINFKFDFTNLPEGTTEDQLVSMLQSAITDKSVINTLVNNPDFQSIDSRVKNKIALKQGRARGA